jgi:hypothetical protein
MNRPDGENQEDILNNPFGTKDLLQLVVKKLSSQALLFSLAIIVILVISRRLLGDQALPIIAAILFVFAFGTVAYLFFEQKGKAEGGDQATMSELLGEKVNVIKNSAGNFSVQVWTAPATVAGSRDIKVVPAGKRAEYRVGDKIVVHFRADWDCHLTLLNIGTSGKLTILFPNALHRDGFISANKEYQIPAPEYGFEYALQGPPGVEKLKAIATLEKVELLESQFASDGSFFRTVEPTAGARDIAVIKKTVESISNQHWAEAAWEFRVG